MSADSLFALASLTKPLVAAAAMIAVEEGALDLDIPVSEYLHTFGTDSRRSITSRHLLSHASGLPEVGPKGVAAIDVEPVCPPATRRIYSNEGYAVLGSVLAAATGIDHPAYVREAVFEPLGMDAFLGLPESEYGRALDVRQPGLAGSGVALFNSAEWRRRATAAGGAFATAEGYGRFVQMLLAGGTPLMAAETFAEMTAVAFPGLPGGIESFQIWDEADWSLGCEVRGHKAPHWTGRAPRRDAVAFRRRGNALLRRSRGPSGTRLPGQPQHLLGLDDETCGWPDLCAAVIAEWGAK